MPKMLALLLYGWFAITAFLVLADSIPTLLWSPSSLEASYHTTGRHYHRRVR